MFVTFPHQWLSSGSNMGFTVVLMDTLVALAAQAGNQVACPSIGGRPTLSTYAIFISSRNSDRAYANAVKEEKQAQDRRCGRRYFERCSPACSGRDGSAVFIIALYYLTSRWC